jgi:membrane-bound lytic murein transglycosylase A
MFKGSTWLPALPKSLRCGLNPSSRRVLIASNLNYPSFASLGPIGLASFLLATGIGHPVALALPPVPRQPTAQARQPLIPLTGPIPANLGLDDQLWGKEGDRRALLRSLGHSLTYLATDKAKADYAKLNLPGISHDRVQRSLIRFKQLLVAATSPQQFRASVLKEFVVYQSIGKDGQGTVDYTGYFEPIYRASRKPTATYRYPLFSKPEDLDRWPKPHPTRLELEGADGRGSATLKGLELVWLADRLQAFLVQVQGSAKLRLTDGSLMTIGYAGKTDHDFVSLGRMLITDKKVAEDTVTLPIVLDYFKKNPAEVDRYVPRNPRYVFFKDTAGSPPIGNLNQPVTADRSIATDRSVFPPGALALIQTKIPYPRSAKSAPTPPYPARLVNRFVLDQDTGGAIKGPGRVDIFLGTGPVAGDRAGLVNTPGQLFYFLVKDGR